MPLKSTKAAPIRVIRPIGSQGILKNLFHTEIVRFESKKWPVLSDNQVTTADALLNREYPKTLEQLRKQTTESIDLGAVTAEHLASVQETWKTYRDAWIALARVRYPGAVASIRKSRLTDIAW